MALLVHMALLNSLWLRYVDDTFIFRLHRDMQVFLDHAYSSNVNSVNNEAMCVQSRLFLCVHIYVSVYLRVYIFRNRCRCMLVHGTQRFSKTVRLSIKLKKTFWYRFVRLKSFKSMLPAKKMATVK